MWPPKRIPRGNDVVDKQLKPGDYVTRLAFQSNSCHNTNCTAAHQCAIIFPSGRVCGGRHSACECRDKDEFRLLRQVADRRGLAERSGLELQPDNFPSRVAEDVAEPQRQEEEPPPATAAASGRYGAKRPC